MASQAYRHDAATDYSSTGQQLTGIRKGYLNRSLDNNHEVDQDVLSRSGTRSGVFQIRKQSAKLRQPAFNFQDATIPDREARIKPDPARSYLSEMPKRYEQAKLRNVITRSLRRAAEERKEIFGASSIIYTG